MTLKTNLKELEQEFIEEIKFFDGYKNLEIEHIYHGNENEFINEFTVNGVRSEYRNVKNISDLTEKKRYTHRFAKLGLYKSLSEHFGISLPWGALTGIRPVKFAYGEGGNWREYMSGEMGVSSEKLDMVAKILEEQKGIYELKEGNTDLFIDIPFCPSRCLYCSFMSCEIGKAKNISEYTDTLCREIEVAKPLIKNLRSVYIGGGTPVSLPIYETEKFLQAIGNVSTEYTVEAGRPDCINDEVLALLKKYGVSRICVNPQTFSDDTLKLLGRKHTVKDIYDKYAMAQKYGFSINMDLIAGLPGENIETFKNSVDRAIELSPDNITVHTLSLKKGSKLKELVERLDDSLIGNMIDYSYKSLTENSYNPYYMYRQKYMAGNLENTGYTKKGKACVYNIDIMEEITDNVACGANAVSKRLYLKEDRIERYGAPKDIKTYIDKIDKVIEEKNRLFR